MFLLGIVPDSLFGESMIEHVRKWRKYLCFHPINYNPENPASNNNPSPAIFLKSIPFPKLIRPVTNSIIILFQVNNFFPDLEQER